MYNDVQLERMMRLNESQPSPKNCVYLSCQLYVTNNSLITLGLIKNRRLLCKDIWRSNETIDKAFCFGTSVASGVEKLDLRTQENET